MVFAEGDHRDPRDCHNEDNERGEVEDDLVGVSRDKVLLAQQLDAVGYGLQESLRPGAVWTDTVLHGGQHFALVPRHVGHADEKNVHEDERHHKRQPDRLIHTSALLLLTRPTSC